MAEEKKTPEIVKEPQITVLELASLVKEMRFNQRRYFNTGKPHILETCKKLEKQVDEIVYKLFDTQMNLF